jgi:hypothetical protein
MNPEPMNPEQRMVAGWQPRLLTATGKEAPVSKPTVVVNFLQAFLAVVLGNVVYFLLVPSFPSAARHRPMHLDLGMLIDFWFCLAAYGLIRTARKWK